MKVFLCTLILALSGGVSAADGGDNFKIDPNHTSIVFKISHLGFSNVYGIFSGADGKFTINDANPEKSSVEFSMKPETVNTAVTKRDDHIRSPDFFNVKQFPLISFKSKTVKKKDASHYEIAGDLTMHGVTKPVTFTFERFGTGKDPWGGTRTGGEAVFTVKRSLFDMKFMSEPGKVGDDVEMRVSLEGTKI